MFWGILPLALWGCSTAGCLHSREAISLCSIQSEEWNSQDFTEVTEVDGNVVDFLQIQAQRAMRQREQRERIAGLSVSGGGSGRGSGSDVKQVGCPSCSHVLVPFSSFPFLCLFLTRYGASRCQVAAAWSFAVCGFCSDLCLSCIEPCPLRLSREVFSCVQALPHSCLWITPLLFFRFGLLCQSRLCGLRELLPSLAF